ncbi:MAG: leucine--tRNA ligase [Alphaproteobacteria bacterium]
MTTASYTPQTIEQKWQQSWFSANLESSPFYVQADTAKPKYYVLEMLPYPSGQLHMGHVRNYTLGDVLARYKRAAGFNVMHPMGWDSFGLPAENAAIKRNIPPQDWTLANIAEMKRTMQQFGWSYDWSKEITSCLPNYYGPQQALFLDLAAKGLVYRKESLVNWDPVDNTVLANEQVVDGKGWRSGAPVERRLMPQWMMRITQYADQLLADLEKLPNWPARVRLMQENWLGKSTGLQFSFKVNGWDKTLDVFTTRPDTLYGATFCAVAPEHPLATLTAQNDPQARLFVEEASAMGTAQEIIDKAEKKGFKTPYTAIHPLTDEPLPIYIANFVLMTYGTGALMAVPAHDERDHAFAIKYNLKIKRVIDNKNLQEADREFGQLPYVEPYGKLVNSFDLNDLDVDDAKTKIIAKAETEGWGHGVTQWRLRDWGISRQRCWGCPIPFIHCPTCGVVPVPKAQLPVALPNDVQFTGSGNPLDNHPTWKHTTCPTCNGQATRETDTMDTFMDSSWYFLRYLCPDAAEPLDNAKVAYWMGTNQSSRNPGIQTTQGVDQYIGGIEHAVLHLLYARFFTKALRDCGYPVGDEPFAALLCQGMVIGNTYQAPNGDYIYPSQVEWRDSKAYLKGTDTPLKVSPAEKISKSKNNGDSPDELLAKYGADTLRLFILFTAPPERDLEWSEQAIEGAWRFLNRLWTLTERASLDNYANEDLKRNGLNISPTDVGMKAVNRKIHQTIHKVTEDINKFQYNTMVAACMELANTLQKFADIHTLKGNNSPSEMAYLFRFGVEALVRLLNPAVPHITEELWAVLGHATPLTATEWLKYDEAAAKEDEITLVVQIDGKVRARLTVPADISQEDALAQALAAPEAQNHLQGRTIVKKVYVPSKLVSIATAS